MNHSLYQKTFRPLLIIVLAGIILIYARPFLVPLCFAALFSLLLLPLSLRFKKMGMGHGFSILVTVLIFLIIISGLLTVLAWQITDLSQHSTEIEKNFNEKLGEFKDYISSTFGISRQKQTEILQEQQASGGRITTIISGIIASAGTFLAHVILTLVYIFLFLYYRARLKHFVLMRLPKGERENAVNIMDGAKAVVQKYLTGMAWMILCLWVMYSIGFSIVGVRNAVFFAILCGLLEIVPFVGNLTGNLITVLAVIMQGGSTGMMLGVIVTYAIVQFLQTYLLEPLVVGKGVSINPLFTIAGIVAGELIWGVPGMILAIPVMGVTKIICDHVESLKPYGYLMGTEKKS